MLRLRSIWNWLRRPRRSRLRWALWLGLGLVALVALLLGGVVGVIHSLDRPYARRRIQALARQHAGVDIDYASTETWAGPLSGLRLRGLVVRTPAGFADAAPDLLRVDDVELEWSTTSLLGGATPRGRLVLRGVELTVVRDEDGRTSLSALGPPPPPPPTGPVPPPPPPIPPSGQLAALFGQPAAVLGHVTLEDARVTLIRRDHGRVLDRLRVQGLGLELSADSARPGWRVSAQAGLQATPLSVQVTHAPEGRPAHEALGRLWLQLSAAPAEVALKLALRFERQTFLPRLPAGLLEHALQLDVRVRPAPPRHQTDVTLQRLEVGDGAAALSAALVLPDTLEAPVLLQQIKLAVDAARLLPLVPADVWPPGVHVRAHKAQLHLEASGLSGTLTGLPQLAEGRIDERRSASLRAIELGATWDGVRARLPAGDLDLDRGHLTAQLSPEAGPRHRVKLSGHLGLLSFARPGLHVEANGAGLTAGARLHDLLPTELHLDLPITRLHVAKSRGGGDRDLLDAPVRVGLRARDLALDRAHPERTPVDAQLDLEVGAAKAQASVQRRGGRLDYLVSVAADSLGLVAPAARDLPAQLPWERMGLQLRSQGRVTGVGGARSALQLDQRTDVRLAHPGVTGGGQSLSADALVLGLTSRGGARKLSAEADLQLRGLRQAGARPLGDGHVKLGLGYDLSTAATSSVRLRLDADTPTGPEGSVALALGFDRAARTLSYDLDSRLARLQPLQPLLDRVHAARGFDLKALSVALSGRGVVSGLVESVAADGTPRLAARPVDSVGVDGGLDLRVQGFRWAEGDRLVQAPSLRWRATLRREGDRRFLRADLAADSLHLLLGEHQIDLARFSDDLELTVRGDPRLGEGELTQRLKLGALRQDYAPEYATADLTCNLQASRSRDGVVRITALKLDNPAAGTVLSLRGGLDLGDERRSLFLRGELEQQLERLWQAPRVYQGQGRASLGLRVESGNLSLFHVQAAVKVAGAHLRLPGRGVSIEALDGEIPLRLDLLLGRRGLRLLRDARVNAYSELRFADQHPLLDRRSFLSIKRVTTPWVTVGPVAGNLSIENNLIAINQLELGVRGGRVTGEGLVRWSEKDTSLQLHARATGLLSSHRERFDGNAAVEFTTRERNLDGRAEILRIGKRHLLDLLDLHDPHHADPSVNRIRSALSLGYPDHVRLSFDHGFAAVRIAFGGLARLVRIDELRGIPTGPILDKVLARPAPDKNDENGDKGP